MIKIIIITMLVFWVLSLLLSIYIIIKSLIDKNKHDFNVGFEMFFLFLLSGYISFPIFMIEFAISQRFK